MGFNAWAKAVVAPSGDLFVYESSGVSGQRTSRQIRADEADRFNFGIVLEGRRIHRDETDEVSIAGPGDFFSYDAAKPSRVEWSDHRGIHLSLPRQMVQSVIGDIPPGSVVARKLSTSSLAPFLKSQLGVLARELASLSDIDRAAIFDNTMDLALTVLRQAFANPSKPPALDRRGCVAFARRIIIEQLANPNLDAAMIARSLGCSRATLYRAFAEYGLSVASYIRETRLEEAMRLIATGSVQLTIESIANQCGFVDVTHFRRAFRARFGMSPQEARTLLAETAL